MTKNEFGDLFREGTEIRKLLVAFMRSMVMPRSGVKHIRKTPSWTEEVWERYERITGKQRPERFRTVEMTDDDDDVPNAHGEREKSDATVKY